MKVVCIKDVNRVTGRKMQIKKGSIYTASQCRVYPNNWDLKEVPEYKGLPISYEKIYFAPIITQYADMTASIASEHKETSEVPDEINVPVNS